MHARIRRDLVCSCAAWACLFTLTPLAVAQAVKGKVSADDPPPAVTYHSLIPGLSTSADVRKALGEPMHEAKWYAWKMLYPAKGRPGLLDSLHLDGGRDGRFACAEVASVPTGYETREM